MSGLWIYHGSKYVRITQGSEYALICLNNFWICLIMLECASISLNGFCFKFTHFNSISKGKTVFLESKNLIFFSIIAGSI